MSTDFSKLDFTSKIAQPKVIPPKVVPTTPTLPKYQYQPLTPSAFRQAPSTLKVTKEQQKVNEQRLLQELSSKDAKVAGIAKGFGVGIVDQFGVPSLISNATGKNYFQQTPEVSKLTEGLTYNAGSMDTQKNTRATQQGLTPYSKGAVDFKIKSDTVGGILSSVIGVDLVGLGLSKLWKLAISKSAKKLGVLDNVIEDAIINQDEATIKNIADEVKVEVDNIKTTQPLYKTPDGTLEPQTIQGGTLASNEGIIPTNKEFHISSMTEKEIENLANIRKKQEATSGLPPEETLKTASSKIVNAEPKSIASKVKESLTKENLSKVSEDLRVAWTDRLASLERLEKDITGNISEAGSSLYKQARLFSGVPEQAMGRIEFGLKPVIRIAEDAGYTADDLSKYSAAVHARDVNKVGIDSGLTNEEIDSIINHYTSGKPIDSNPIEIARQGLLKYNDSLIQELADSGRISQESLDAMRIKYPNYVPLKRDMDIVEKEFGFFPSEKFSNSRMPIKKLKGSEKAIINPLESIIGNTYEILASSAQAQVGKTLKNLADLDFDGEYIKKLATFEKAKNKNVVTVFENGQEVRYAVDENVYKAMNGLNQETTGMLIKILAAPTSWLRAGATLTPEFAARNPMRDIIQAYILKGFNPIKDFGKGIYSYAKKDDLYKRFLESKAGYGNFTSLDRTSRLKILKDITKQPVSGKIINIVNPESYLELLRIITDTTETATKLGMFKKGIREGLSDAESAYQARDLMDFARAGSQGKELNKISAFFNANIQGKSKIYRAIKEDPKGVTARLFKALVIPTITVKAWQYKYANEEQKKRIQDAPDWEKDTFYLIPIPTTNYIARIPKPFDLAIVANATERAMDYLIQNDPTAFEGLAKDTLKNTLPPIIPTALTPAIESMPKGGYSFFRGASIVPFREQDLPKEMQQDVYTSELPKALSSKVRQVFGESANLGSPRIMENTIKGYTAGLGQYSMDIYDFIAGKTYAKDIQKPEKTLTQKPLVRAFLMNNMSTGKSMSYVYDTFNELNTKNNGLKQQGEKLTGKEMEKFKDITNYKEAISAVSKDMRDISNSASYSPEEKTKLLVELNKERNDYSIKAYDTYKGDTTQGIPFYSKYNLSENQTKNLAFAESKGLTEQQVLRGYSEISGLKLKKEKYDAIMKLPYSQEVKNRLFQIISK